MDPCSRMSVLDTPDHGDAVMVKALQYVATAAVAPYKYPRAVKFREVLPGIKAGKLPRSRLRG